MSRYVPARVPDDVFDVIQAIAKAETGENVSKAVRKLLDEALEGRTHRTHRTQNEPQTEPVAVTQRTHRTQPAIPVQADLAEPARVRTEKTTAEILAERRAARLGH